MDEFVAFFTAYNNRRHAGLVAFGGRDSPSVGSGAGRDSPSVGSGTPLGGRTWSWTSRSCMNPYGCCYQPRLLKPRLLKLRLLKPGLLKADDLSIALQLQPPSPQLQTPRHLSIAARVAAANA